MKNNIGKIIQKVSTILFTIILIVTLVFGIVLTSDDSTKLVGFMMIFLGVFVCGFSYIFFYGYGFLIEKVKSIDEKLSNINPKKDV